MGLLSALQGGFIEQQMMKKELREGEQILAELAGEVLPMQGQMLNRMIRDQKGCLFITNQRAVFIGKNFIGGDDYMQWALPTFQVQTRGIARMAIVECGGPEGGIGLRIGIAAQGRNLEQKLAQIKASL